MHALLSVVLIAALVGVHAEAAKLHLHLSDDHRHAEHQHGLAAHHHGAQRHADELGIEQCDPAVHAVAVALCTIVPNHLRVVAFDTVTMSPIVEQPMPRGFAASIDVRVHGPPDYAQRPLRAPPASIPA